MKLLDLTLPAHAANLALDEALVEAAEDGGPPGEVLRIWEPCSPLVVVGRASRWREEVDVDACRRRGIPVFRRASGGAAVVCGPGCLMYAVVLSYRRRPALRAVDQAHRFVLGRIRQGLAAVGRQTRCAGASDLALGERKFSGNSLRCRRDYLLYHGTLLYDFDLDLIRHCLRHPPREPDYRAGRGHDDFITNLPADAAELRLALNVAFPAGEVLDSWPSERTNRLVAEKYGSAKWNEER